MINDKNRSQKILTFKTDRNRTSIQLSLAFRPFQVEIFQPVIQNCPKFTSKVTFDNDFSTVFSLVGKTDSISSEIRMGQAANGRGLCDIEHVLLRLPKSPKIGKAKLSVYFRRARTSQFPYRYHTVHVRWLPDP